MQYNYKSLSARRAWIEIVYPGTWSGSILVALRKESVDRNREVVVEEVDIIPVVALRKESVDRNPSTARSVSSKILVALRKESVDRNTTIGYVMSKSRLSLSARRAWIEIYKLRIHQKQEKVALRKESVDRNVNRLKTPCVRLCRSPQGERG